MIHGTLYWLKTFGAFSEAVSKMINLNVIITNRICFLKN